MEENDKSQMFFFGNHSIVGRVSSYIPNEGFEVGYDPQGLAFWKKYPIIKPYIKGFIKNINLNEIYQLDDYHVYSIISKYKNVDTSYLFSAIASNKEANQVFQYLKFLANQIIYSSPKSDWYGKIITTNCSPFKIISIFITNFQYPQVVGIGDNLIYAIKKYSSKIWGNNAKKFTQKWFDALAPLIYVYQPIDPGKLYARQLINLNRTPKKVEDTIKGLVKLEQKYLEQIKNEMINNYYNKGNGLTSVIIPLSLDNIYKWYQYDHPKETKIEKGDEIKTDPDFKELIKYLSSQSNDKKGY